MDYGFSDVLKHGRPAPLGSLAWHYGITVIAILKALDPPLKAAEDDNGENGDNSDTGKTCISLRSEVSPRILI
jgi:hypothetical protein